MKRLQRLIFQKKVTRLELIKTCIRIFTVSKNKLNQGHQYAICLLTDETVWYQGFTSEVEVLNSKLQDIDGQSSFEQIDMSKFFEVISTNCPDITSQDHNYIYRCIFIYSRSSVIPELENKDLPILGYNNFYFDSIFLHSKASKENHVDEIIEFIDGLNSEKRGYNFDISNSKKLYLNFANLLAHPLQRGEQSNFTFTTFK